MATGAVAARRGEEGEGGEGEGECEAKGGGGRGMWWQRRQGPRWRCPRGNKRARDMPWPYLPSHTSMADEGRCMHA